MSFPKQCPPSACVWDGVKVKWTQAVCSLIFRLSAVTFCSHHIYAHTYHLTAKQCKGSREKNSKGRILLTVADSGLSYMQVKNLRSVVSRAAVICLGDLFNYLKKNMDQELDNTVKVLLHKAGESNTFIREDVDKALKAMVNNVTSARALSSLINGGQR